ncbi:MAG: hypothetical protein VB140_03535 [Burkholderia sp.]
MQQRRVNWLEAEKALAWQHVKYVAVGIQLNRHAQAACGFRLNMWRICPAREGIFGGSMEVKWIDDDAGLQPNLRGCVRARQVRMLGNLVVGPARACAG